MPPRKPRRWLPEHVSCFRDRHGRTRYRYRKVGEKTHYFKAEPGTPEFMEELSGASSQGGLTIRSSTNVAPGSMDDLANKLFASPPMVTHEGI